MSVSGSGRMAGTFAILPKSRLNGAARPFQKRARGSNYM